MGMRGLQIAQACAEESTDSGASFLSRNEHALSCQVASCRPQALAACALPDAGTLKSAQIKALDFRIYFAIIRSALAVYPRTPVNKTQRRKRLRLVILGLRPSADSWVYWVSLGGIGWKPGGQGRGRGDCQYRRHCQRSPEVEEQGLTADRRDILTDGKGRIRGSLVVVLQRMCWNPEAAIAPENG